MKKIFWTESQMDEAKAVCNQCEAPKEVLKEIERVLQILDSVYGSNRKVWRDDGGFVLFCTEPLSEGQVNKILKKYHVCSGDAEYREVVTHEGKPDWEIRLYIITNDYGITMIFPSAEEGSRWNTVF